MVLPAILQPVGCLRPHEVEVFGVTPTHSKNVTQAQLDASCAELAKRLTRMPDPTAASRLTVTAAAMHLKPDGEGDLGFSTSESESGFAICSIIAPKTHRLKGSLLNIGTGAIPWA